MTTNLPMNKRKMTNRWLHVLWLLPGLWLVGCSTDKGAEAVDSTAPRPITFTITTEDAPEETRGYPLDELDAEFGLFCAKYDEDEWGELGQPLNFMYNEMVIGSGSSWSTSEGYFVPKEENMKFFAYFPYYEDVRYGTSPIKMYGSELTAYPAPSFTYTMPDNAEEQQDLMYAISDQVHADANGKLSTVHLHFRHLLTAITFAARSTESCTLKRVTLKNLYKRGDFEFKEDDASGNPPVLRADAAENENGGFGDVYVDLDMKLKTSYKTADAGKSFMLILQPVDDNENIVMSSEAAMWVTIEVGGQDYTFKKSLADLAPALIASKNTLIRLSVESLKRITIGATITNWGHGANFDGAVSDQPTLELEPLIIDWDDEDSNGNSTTTDFVTGPQTTNP